MKTYTVHQDYIAKENSIIDVIHLDDFVDVQKYRVDNACINNGGWQSWNPCTETFPGKKQKSKNDSQSKEKSKLLKLLLLCRL